MADSGHLRADITKAEQSQGFATKFFAVRRVPAPVAYSFIHTLSYCDDRIFSRTDTFFPELWQEISVTLTTYKGGESTCKLAS